MKLRNKKTGEIRELGEDSDYIYLMHFCPVKREQLIDGDWELYLEHEKTTLKKDGKEPLIKDEKISKAVRAWAEANNIRVVRVKDDYCFIDTESAANIRFYDKIGVFLKGNYTIAELCGEEE